MAIGLLKLLNSPLLSTTWEQRKFSDLFSYERPDAYIVNNDEYDDSNPTPVLTANKGFILGYTAETRTHEGPCVIFDDFTLDCKLVTFPFMVKSSAIKILHCHDGVDLTFAYERLCSAKIEALGHARHYISVVQNTESAIPSYEEQSAIGRVLSNLDTLITLHQRERNIAISASQVASHAQKLQLTRNNLFELSDLLLILVYELLHLGQVDFFLFFKSVDVTRNVQIVIVFLDLF